MSKPVIIDIYCDDIDYIDEWCPDDPNEVSFLLTVLLGPDSDGGDYFYVDVCTPLMARRLQDKRSLLIVPYYESCQSVLEALDAVLEECRGYDWFDMSQKLAKKFVWEYEGMAGS